MKVILREEVKSLGAIGDIVTVKPGYARNYLIPKGYAVVADTKNVKAFEHEKRISGEKARKALDAARGLAGEIEKVKLTFPAKAGEEEKLFGSITSMDIAAALADAGFDVDRRKIVLDEPIKRLGTYTVDVKVAPEVSAAVSVEVVAE
jgi:large subunit ribosomal protein L9